MYLNHNFITMQHCSVAIVIFYYFYSISLTIFYTLYLFPTYCGIFTFCVAIVFLYYFYFTSLTINHFMSNASSLTSGKLFILFRKIFDLINDFLYIALSLVIHSKLVNNVAYSFQESLSQNFPFKNKVQNRKNVKLFNVEMIMYIYVLMLL